MPLPNGKVGEAIINKYFKTEKWEESYILNTTDLKSISDYTGLNFKEVESLFYVEFLLYRKEAFIYNLKQTENGQEFLKALHRLNQTSADISAVREAQGRGR